MNYCRHVSYTPNAGGDSLAITSSSYRNSSSVVDTTSLPTLKLAEFSCVSSGSPPTNITWLRNGQRINKEHGFHTGVRVINRYSYIFNNTLSVYNVTGAVGRNIYTCIIKNQVGTATEVFNFVNTGIDNTYTFRKLVTCSCNYYTHLLLYRISAHYIFTGNISWREVSVDMQSKAPSRSIQSYNTATLDWTS